MMMSNLSRNHVYPTIHRDQLAEKLIPTFRHLRVSFGKMISNFFAIKFLHHKKFVNNFAF